MTEAHAASDGGGGAPGDDTAPVLVIAGPTASGKSALALALAERHGGTVINADAMQCYRDLRVLTARPTPDDERRVPHRLYGTRDAADTVTAARWRRDAVAAIADAVASGRRPILCGGTGLYLHALSRGLADIPDPGAAARAEARALLATGGAHALHARLCAVDPCTAARLRPSDSQRLARAWEVWRGTGTGLAAWQDRTADTPPTRRIGLVLLRAERPILRRRIAARFDAMLAAGAVAEVAALLARDLDPALPAMRAHGVPELAGLIRGTLDRDAAVARAVTAISRYTRRQETWFRHHRLADPSDTVMIDIGENDPAQQMQSVERCFGWFFAGSG